MPEAALTSFTVYDAHRYICASGIVIERVWFTSGSDISSGAAKYKQWAYTHPL